MDVDSRARDLCITLAKVNNLAERVVIEGECTHDRLNTLIKGRTLIICDCEGCELQLLDPLLAPGLKNTDLLIELHDMIDPAITPTIRCRFSETHEIPSFP